MRFVILTFLTFLSSFTNAQDCKLYPKRPLGVTDKYNGVKDEQLSASSAFSTDTQAKYARLHYSDAFYWDNDIKGAGAWVARNQDIQQYIQVDLGKRYVIQGIATQGRQGSREWIEDYYVYYADSDPPKQWAVYRDEFGQPFEFPGNWDDNTVVINELKYPIIARYLRINPQRWHSQISLRFELLGCDYIHYGASFDGNSRIDLRLDGTRRAVQTARDEIRFRFRTTEINGLILYGDDGQGDFLSIELFRARLRININLGGVVNTPPDIYRNTIDAGSLLDDNMWHDVSMVRTQKMFNISVDRIETWRNLTSAMMHLNMNRNLSLGGIANVAGRDGITVRKNFVGCMEEVWFNGINLIRDGRRVLNKEAEANMDWQTVMQYPARNPQVWWGNELTEGDLNLSGANVVGTLGTTCAASSVDSTVVTFPGISESYLTVEKDNQAILTLALEFRSFSHGGTFFYNNIYKHIKLVWIGMDENTGFIQVEINMDGIRPVFVEVKNFDPESLGGTFADGLWHTMTINIIMNEIQLTVDGRDFSTYQVFTQNLAFSSKILIGGGRPGKPGFRGCSRMIRVANDPVLYDLLSPANRGTNIVSGICNLIDLCMPNPCKHQAPCTQKGDQFFCNCTFTGYAGALCHQSEYPTSCSEAALFYREQHSLYSTWIDIDASGILLPIKVECDFSNPDIVRTLVNHDLMNFTRVDGYDAPGSYRKTVNYVGGDRSALGELTRRAIYCEQAISYKCTNAKLLETPNIGGGTSYENRAYGWWVGRQGQPRYYWGGSVPGHKKCACGVLGTCGGDSYSCNCDGSGSKNPPELDSGLLQYKEDLPVTEVRFGDTGTSFDSKYAEFSIGPLVCEGDTLFDNTVTFRKPDSNIELPPIYAETEFDLTFLFKTTITDAVFLQNTGRVSEHSLEVRLRQGDTIRFAFNVGNGAQILEKLSARKLNDNMWHVLRIERNRKESRLIIDDYQPVTFPEPTDRVFEMFKFDNNLIIGSTEAFTDGYLGCIGNLIINGVTQDLRGRVERKEVVYGVSAGCQPKCEQNPCRNRGECYEFYSHYYCECGMTPFRGYICAREVGANFRKGAMLKITFPKNEDLLGSLDEYIQIGFMTNHKQGHLFQLSSRDMREYIIIKVNNNGGISIEFDVGFKRYEITTNFGSIDLTTNQHHTVYAWRSNLGKKWHLKVDDYPEIVQDYSDLLAESSDTRLDDPAYLFIGRNESMTSEQGFEGCIYRIQFNNVFPLKMAFKDQKNPEHDLIELTPITDILEDKCGYEEIMPENEPIEIRPFPTIPPNINFTFYETYQANYQGAIAGGIVTILLILIILGLILFCRHFTLDKGDYYTREAKGANLADTPDLAIKYGRSGQPEVKGKEWWI